MPRNGDVRDRDNSEDLNIFRLDDVIERGIPDLERRLLPHSVVRITVHRMPWFIHAARNELFLKVRSRYPDRITGKRVFDIYCMRAGLNSFYHEWRRDLRKHLIIEREFFRSDIPMPIKDILMKKLYDRSRSSVLNVFDTNHIVTKRADITMLIEDAERMHQYASAFLVTQSVIIIASLIEAYLNVADDSMKKDLRYYKMLVENFLDKRRRIWDEIKEDLKRDVVFALWQWLKSRGRVYISEIEEWADANGYDKEEVYHALSILEYKVKCVRREGLMIIYDESAYEYGLGEL
ncbi:MAG: hypothetical protein DRN90_02140 [Thermoproteota archaeon]|nr:MAG: hypothetical protein DRN90_02140 [Candidatus Korarchaeota archaeon]